MGSSRHDPAADRPTSARASPDLRSSAHSVGSVNLQGYVLAAAVVMLLVYALPALVDRRRLIAASRIEDRHSDRLRVLATVGDGARRGAGGGVAVAERLSTHHNVASEGVRMEVSSHNPDDAQIVVHTRGAWRIKGIIQVRAR